MVNSQENFENKIYMFSQTSELKIKMYGARIIA